MAKVVQVKVVAGRTVPNPHVAFANFKPELELTLEIEPGDDPKRIVSDAQNLANQLLEDHIDTLLNSRI